MSNLLNTAIEYAQAKRTLDTLIEHAPGGEHHKQREAVEEAEKRFDKAFRYAVEVEVERLVRHMYVNHEPVELFN
jgi:hypothetical protein